MIKHIPAQILALIVCALHVPVIVRTWQLTSICTRIHVHRKADICVTYIGSAWRAWNGGARHGGTCRIDERSRHESLSLVLKP